MSRIKRVNFNKKLVHISFCRGWNFQNKQLFTSYDTWDWLVLIIKYINDNRTGRMNKINMTMSDENKTKKVNSNMVHLFNQQQNTIQYLNIWLNIYCISWIYLQSNNTIKFRTTQNKYFFIYLTTNFALLKSLMLLHSQLYHFMKIHFQFSMGTFNGLV